jgi:hypothetical protein
VSEPSYLESLGARSTSSDGSLSVGGHQVSLVRGEFRGLAGRWTLEQASFVGCGMAWRLTASVDVRDRGLFPLMLRTLHSFQLACR